MGSEYILGPNGELYHWGIKGMRWGVRRYQNEDGTLTEAGKKRRAKLEAKLDKLGGKSPEKKLAEMTDEEVIAKTNRMRIENNLRDEERRRATQEEQQRNLQSQQKKPEIDPKAEKLKKKIARLQLEEQYRNLKNSKKVAEDKDTEKLRKEVDRLALEKRYKDLQKELNPPKNDFMSKIGNKALNDVILPTATSAGKSYLDKLIKKYSGDKDPSIEDLLKEYGDLSDDERKRYQQAAAVKGWSDALLGKKNNNK